MRFNCLTSILVSTFVIRKTSHVNFVSLSSTALTRLLVNINCISLTGLLYLLKKITTFLIYAGNLSPKSEYQVGQHFIELWDVVLTCESHEFKYPQ